ncbi:MAG: hypothetical protein ACRC56_03845 [Bosea sp. (in: a-proteobacteria)]
MSREAQAEARQKKLAASLRENLKRRKAQARGRQALDADNAVEAAPAAAAPEPPEPSRP